MQMRSENSHPSLYNFSIPTLCAKYYLKGIINETESVRSFKTVTWHCLQPVSLGSTLLIICLLFQSLWGWCHTSNIRGIACSSKYRLCHSPPFFGKYNLKLRRTSLLSCCLLWTEHTPFRTTGFQKVSKYLAILFWLLYDNQKMHMIL